MQAKSFIINNRLPRKNKILAKQSRENITKPIIKKSFSLSRFIPDEQVKRIRIIEVAMGRLGMVGLISALYGELFKHKTIIQQFNCEPENIIVLSLAIFGISIYPSISIGCDHKNRVTEKLIGRYAMIFFAVLVYMETNGLHLVQKL
jgi:hypothetical protein